MNQLYKFQLAYYNQVIQCSSFSREAKNLDSKVKNSCPKNFIYKESWQQVEHGSIYLETYF